MIPVGFEQANAVLEKPVGWTDEQCMSLSVFKGLDAGGFPVIVSCWQLNKEELELIQKTGRVYCMIVSNVTPPLSLHVESPFE